MTRLSLFIVALLGGMALASFVPGLSERIRIAFPFFEPAAVTKGDESATGERKPGAEASDDQQSVKLSAEAIEAAGIDVAPVQSGAIAHRIVVHGTIVPHADRIAHVAVKLFGIVAELRKKIGDPVAMDEVLAVLDSREVADAKSEYLAARVTSELEQEMLERDTILWERKVLAEQQVLRSRNLAANAKIRNDIARQKLFALGLTEKEIMDLPSEPEASLRRQEIRSPMAGRVVDRKVELGVAVGRDNLETELFVVADLNPVWAELAVSPEDAPLVRNGETVSVSARGGSEKADGKVVFISPMLDKETRSARVMAEIDNKDGVWRPGSFVTAAIAFDERSVPLAVPLGAIQTMGTGPVVFVRTAEGFEKRPVVIGQSDDRASEVVSSLRPGEMIAVSNTFLLKAEMLKGQDED